MMHRRNVNYLYNLSNVLTALFKRDFYVSCYSVVVGQCNARMTSKHQLTELTVINDLHGMVALSYPSDNVCTVKQC